MCPIFRYFQVLLVIGGLTYFSWLGVQNVSKNVQNVSNYLDTSWTYFGHCLDISNYFRHLSWRCPKNVQKFWTFHTTLDTSWTCFGHIIELDIFWTYVGQILDMLWTLLNPLDAFWTLLCPKCVRPHIVHQSPDMVPIMYSFHWPARAMLQVIEDLRA